ncbi:MAG: right-handed parallel beta-helix repeat-containing protein [Myxococcota bacterium]
MIRMDSMRRGARRSLRREARRRRSAALSAVVGMVAGGAAAEDGAIEIHQIRALAGSVVPGDAPGFPVTIGRSGRYRLTSNLVVSSPGISAIRVDAPDVVLDLNGFSIEGPNVCTGEGETLDCGPIGSANGVFATQENVVVRNGTLRGFSSNGASFASGFRAIDLFLTENAIHGLSSSGDGEVQGCVAFRNGFAGLSPGRRSNLLHNVASGNGTNGIQAAQGTRIVGNSLWQNGGRGISLANSGLSGGLVEHNAVVDNGGDGMLIGDGVLAISNSIRANGGNGLSVVLGAAYGYNNVRANGGITITVTGGDVASNVCEGNLSCP